MTSALSGSQPDEFGFSTALQRARAVAPEEVSFSFDPATLSHCRVQDDAVQDDAAQDDAPARFAVADEFLAADERRHRAGSVRRRSRRGVPRGRALALGIGATLLVAAGIPVAVFASSLNVTAEESTSTEAIIAPQVLQPIVVAADAGGGFRADSGSYAVQTAGSGTGSSAAVPAPIATVQWPLASKDASVTDGFGPRAAPCSGCSSNHRGVDFSGALGTAVGAIADGTVISVDYGDNGGLGVHVVVEHRIDGQRVQSVYGHLVVGSVTVRVGDVVRVGDRVGSLGNTGASTGPHLHLEIIRNGAHVDPLAFLYRYADGRNVEITDKPALPWAPSQPGNEGEGWTPDQTVTTPPPTPIVTPTPDPTATVHPPAATETATPSPTPDASEPPAPGDTSAPTPPSDTEPPTTVDAASFASVAPSPSAEAVPSSSPDAPAPSETP